MYQRNFLGGRSKKGKREKPSEKKGGGGLGGGLLGKEKSFVLIPGKK